MAITKSISFKSSPDFVIASYNSRSTVCVWTLVLGSIVKPVKSTTEISMSLDLVWRLETNDPYGSTVPPLKLFTDGNTSRS